MFYLPRQQAMHGWWITVPRQRRHPDNQHQLNVIAGGRYDACVKTEVCGSVQVDR
jgi:hypothetical protein